MDPERVSRLEAMQAHKAPRRMRLADDVGLLWESDATVDHQIAEMKAMEDDEEALSAVVAGYAGLRPRPGRLTATVSVEVHDPAHIKQRLGYYAGLEHAFALEVGGQRVPARILGDHGTPEATTAVTYLAFDVPTDADLRVARIVVDHPRLRFEDALPDAVVRSPSSPDGAPS